MNLSTRVRVPPKDQYDRIIREVAPELRRLFTDIETITVDGGALPRELTCGMIVGWLRGRGYSWEECFTAMDHFLSYTLKQSYPVRHAFKMELITCSVGCSPYLEICLTRNMRHFDRTIVVTDPKDTMSCDIARHLGADVLCTDRFYIGGKRFDRGAAYDRALRLLKHNDWVTFLDVDIVLETDHRQRLETLGLRDNVFYGCDRRNLISPETRAAFLNRGDTSGALVQSTTEWGFGYYQMFSVANPFVHDAFSKGGIVYPSAEDVNHSDYLFRKQFGSGHTMTPEGVWTWDAAHQQRLPWHCYHLGSDGGVSHTRHY